MTKVTSSGSSNRLACLVTETNPSSGSKAADPQVPTREVRGGSLQAFLPGSPKDEGPSLQRGRSVGEPQAGGGLFRAMLAAGAGNV